MQEFEYALAHSADEALALLARDGARILSGGTDLLVQLREGRKQAQLLIDIKGVAEANTVALDANGLYLGAAVPCHRIARDAAIVRIYPGLVDAISLIGGIQIQGRATLGGNVCNASPAADSVPALIVHQARAVVVGPGGRRELPVEQLFAGPGRSTLAANEFVIAFRAPPPPAGFGAHYLRFIPRNEMDIAVVGAGAGVVLADGGRLFQWARIALGAVAPTPLLVEEAGARLAGRVVGPEAIAEAAEAARAAARPITDARGSAEQRRRLSAVLTRRALEKAIERARHGLQGG